MTRRQFSIRTGVRRAAVFALAAVAFSATFDAPAHAQEVVEYYATDAVGSIRVVFDAAGQVTSRSDYLPFGEAWAPTGNLPQQRFTGQQRDAEEGFDYLSARSYQPRTGRLNAVDPVFAGLYQPQAWNRYAYALNAPTSFVDPSGLNPILPNPEIPHFTETIYVSNRGGSPAYPWELTGGNYSIDGVRSLPGWSDTGECTICQQYGGLQIVTPGLVLAAASENSGGTPDPPVTSPTTPNPAPNPGPKPNPIPPGGFPSTPVPPKPTDIMKVPGVVGWKTAQYELTANTQRHNVASIVVGSASVVGGLAIAARYFGVVIDGPSKGFAYSQGRLFQLRVGSVPLVRVDLHPRGAGQPPQWHAHILPINGEHGLVFPLWRK